MLGISVALVGVTDHGRLAAWSIAALLLVGAIWPLLALGSMAVVPLAIPTRGVVGQPVVLTLRARNPLPIPLPRLGLRVPGHSTDAALEFTAFPGGRTLSLTLVPRRRGTLSWDQAELTCDFPLGILLGSFRLGGVGTTIVWPRAVEVELPPTFTASHKAGTTPDGMFAGDGEPGGARPYRRGDMVRLIHWQQSARHDRLIVRERESRTVSEAVLILDTRSSSYRCPDEFEQAVSLAAGAVRVATRRHQRVRLLAGPLQLEVVDEPTLVAAMDALADLEVGEVTLSPLPGGIVITSKRASAALAGSGHAIMVVEDVSGMADRECDR